MVIAHRRTSPFDRRMERLERESESQLDNYAVAEKILAKARKDLAAVYLQEKIDGVSDIVGRLQSFRASWFEACEGAVVIHGRDAVKSALISLGLKSHE